MSYEEGSEIDLRYQSSLINIRDHWVGVEMMEGNVRKGSIGVMDRSTRGDLYHMDHHQQHHHRRTLSSGGGSSTSTSMLQSRPNSRHTSLSTSTTSTATSTGKKINISSVSNRRSMKTASSYFSVESLLVLICLTASLLILPVILPPLPPPPFLLLLLPIGILVLLMILAFMPSESRDISSTCV